MPSHDSRGEDQRNGGQWSCRMTQSKPVEGVYQVLAKESAWRKDRPRIKVVRLFWSRATLPPPGLVKMPAAQPFATVGATAKTPAGQWRLTMIAVLS